MIHWLLILGGVAGMIVSYINNEKPNGGKLWVLAVSWLLILSGLWLIAT